MLVNKWMWGLVLAFNALTALEPISDINVSGGYRNDRFTSTIRTFNPDGHDRIKMTGLNIWEVGADMTLKLPNVFIDRCACDYWWLSQFYTRGSVYWGRSCYGHCKEEAKDDFDLILASARGKVHRAHTFDYNLAIGWLFPFNYSFAMGPVVGISYNKLNFRVNVDNFPSLDHFRFSSAYHSTFVGLDALVDTGCAYLRAGYEYHILHEWTGNFKVRGDVVDDFAFSDRRVSKSGYGHVLYGEARFPIEDFYWEWGIKGQLSFFRARRGSCHFYDTHGIEAPDAHTKYAKWLSLSLVADLGYRF